VQPVLFGLAGPAEAALAQAVGLMCLGLFLATVCAALALILRSRLAAIAGLFMVAVIALLFQPWEAFDPKPSNDPDARSFQSSFHKLALQWILVSVAAVGGAVRAFWGRWRVLLTTMFEDNDA
jgi:hypothetical protein